METFLSGGFPFNLTKNTIEKFIKIIFTSLVFCWPVFASETLRFESSDVYVTATNSPVTLKFDLGSTEDGYCVSFVQKNGFGAYRGNANEWIKYINSSEPCEGCAVVMSYGPIGHVALFHNGEIWHQNFEGRGIVSHGPLDKSRVIGYIR